MILIIHHQYLAWQDRQPNHLIVQRVYIDRHWRSDFGTPGAAVYLADKSTAEAEGPGLAQSLIVILVPVIRELDPMKHSERLSISAEPNHVLA